MIIEEVSVVEKGTRFWGRGKGSMVVLVLSSDETEKTRGDG